MSYPHNYGGPGGEYPPKDPRCAIGFSPRGGHLVNTPIPRPTLLPYPPQHGSSMPTPNPTNYFQYPSSQPNYSPQTNLTYPSSKMVSAPQVPYPSSQAPYPSSSPYPTPNPYPISSPYPASSSAHPSTPYPMYPSYETPNPMPAHSGISSTPHAPYPGVQHEATAKMYPALGTTAVPYPTGQGHHSMQDKPSRPTVRPASPFNKEGDAEALRKAMKGIGTDEKAIIAVLAHRANFQRQEIKNVFKAMYGRDLVHDLKSELSGRFEDVVLGLMATPADFLAEEVHRAVSGLGTDETAVIEALIGNKNQEVRAISAAYKAKYGSSIEKDLKNDTSGTFRSIMVAISSGQRAEDTIGLETVQSDARRLYQAGEGRLGTDEACFMAILCQRSTSHLKLVFEEYERQSRRPFEHTIEAEFSGNAKQGLLAIVKCIKNRPKFFAEGLRHSLKGAGTNDKQLIRIIVARCEIDLEDIKQEYQTMYGSSLKKDVENDTSGDYKKCLLALLG